MLKKVTGFIFIIAALFISIAWDKPKNEPDTAMRKWVDSVYNSLNEDQRLGQLFMVAAFSNKDSSHVKEIETLVRDHNIGGLIFFQGGPVRQAVLTNRYQNIARVPLFIAMDAEWGLGMRLDSTMSFPRQMTLGAIPDNKYVYRMGEEIARQCKRLGMQINFAPVVDVNSNPNNPVIGIRSFGEDKINVAQKGIAYMKGMQDQRVMANAKHFPGHGDAGSDSHYTLPVISHDKTRLEDIELYPFRELIKEDVMSIMVAHLHVPAYDNTPNQATTLSKTVVTDLLKKDLAFKGLVFTDALNMKGVANFYKPGEVDVLALLAGNDVLLYAEDVPLAVKKISRAIKKGDISEDEVELRIKKILAAKYWAKLPTDRFVKVENLWGDLNNARAKALEMDLFQKALTVVSNKDQLLPLQLIDTTTFASVSVGIGADNDFQKTLSNYARFSHIAIPDKNCGIEIYNKALDSLRNFDVVVVGIHNTNSKNSKDYGISEGTRDFISRLEAQNQRVIISVFGTPYSLKFFTKSKSLICGYEDNEYTRKLVPQLIFGAFAASGKLPVSILPDFPLGTGVLTASLHRFQFTLPENAGMDSKTLALIDTVAVKTIRDMAAPGMQVLVAKEGKVVYNKSFGYLTYDKQQPVTGETVYDIASITKVAGTLQAVMFLYDHGQINLDEKASTYLTELKGTNKEDLIIRDILTHQAGLTPFIPHWKKTLDANGFMKEYYASAKSELYPNQVCDDLYSCAGIEDSLWKWTIESELIRKKNKKDNYPYVYSDLGFYIMKRIAEKQLNQKIDEFMQHNFFSPMGLQYMTYKPTEKYAADKIAPTENDQIWRKRQVRGNVHDQGAALLGGVAGHAGLFSNASDLAVLMQMNLQNGYYGGNRYLLPETVPAFARKQFPTNRRGLGWDKPEPEGSGPTSDFASPNTFGHTGFTGTAVWIDPDHKLLYIFLSNRIYPDGSNNKLIKNNVRTNIHDVIYKSILNYTYQQ
jgi:beta-N-acetylhexosaminidase